MSSTRFFGAIKGALADRRAHKGDLWNGHVSGIGQRSSVPLVPRGTYTVNTTGYSPTAAAIAQSNANAQNAAMISATVERGQANMAMLERGVIKDNTLMPGEWYGGQLHLQPLVSDDGPTKTYSIAVIVGSDRHEITIVHGLSVPTDCSREGLL